MYGRTMRIDDDHLPNSFKPSITTQHHFVSMDGSAIWTPSHNTVLNTTFSTAGGITLRNPEAEGMVAQRNPTSVQKIKGSSIHVDVLDSKSRKSGTFASVSGSDGASEMTAGGRDVTDDNSNKSEDDLRKERQNQANRESAKRSRLHKRERSNKLKVVAKTLRSKNALLREKLMGLSEKCVEFERENKSIMEELIQAYGLEAISDLQAEYPEFFPQYIDGKRNYNDRD